MSEAASTQEAVAVKKTAKPTSYVVLERQTPASPGSSERWAVFATVVAQGAAAAIRKAYATASTERSEGQSALTLVAVPSRSFQPVTVSVETKTQLVLS